MPKDVYKRQVEELKALPLMDLHMDGVPAVSYTHLIHIGNARPMIVFDTVRRYMEHKGYEVNYVSNFTDVDRCV